MKAGAKRRREQARQTIENLKGEIAFREKLAVQHVTGEVLLPDYYRREEHDEILLARVNATRDKMSELKQNGVHLSPFLELGAERGQRSLVLANDFGATGVAVDISFHQLRSMEHFARLFGREKLPTRVCCDANRLPFRSGAFAFVFCYEFLHHFPSPRPILEEARRVLADGHFYFAEEPYKRVLKVPLYRQRDGLRARSGIRTNKYVQLVESFISDVRPPEEDYGIIEKDDLSLAEWLDAMSAFDEHSAELLSIYNLSSRLSGRFRLKNLPNYLLGGLIAGLCRKRDSATAPEQTNVYELLACPDCTIPASNGGFDRPPLVRSAGRFKCTQCGAEYPERDGVIFLLPHEELRQLYPEIGAG